MPKVSWEGESMTTNIRLANILNEEKEETNKQKYE